MRKGVLTINRFREKVIHTNIFIYNIYIER